MSGFLKRAKELTRQARETASAELLARDQIELAIRTAAGAGADKVTIAPKAPLRIRHTPAAIDAAAWLAAAGFRTQWGEHRPIPTGPAGDQLEIEWA